MGAKKMNLITLDQAVELINSHWGTHIFARKTLLNKISLKELNRYGPTRKAVFVDKDEIMTRYCRG